MFSQVDELEKYVIYVDYSRDDIIITWLFELLREFDEIMKAKFLFFIFGKQNLKKFAFYCFFRLLQSSNWRIQNLSNENKECVR